MISPFPAFRASKRLGQHFLIDTKVAERIIGYAELNREDTVLEVGPGLGVLTEKIASKVKKIIAVEKDRRLVEFLKAKKICNLELLCADALEIEFPEFNKIVANLPYQISSQITFKFLKYKFERAVLMYQKEFAMRMAAEPYSSAYSRLTINVYYAGTCKILESIPRNAFYPVPKVDGAVVLLIPHKKKPFPLVSESMFFDLVNVIFSQRRKKIRNSLLNKWDKFVSSKRDMENIVAHLKNMDRRPEELFPEEIADVANGIVNFIGSKGN